MESVMEVVVNVVETVQQKFAIGLIPSTLCWLLFGTLLFFYWFGIRSYNVLKVAGIPHPSVKPFLGSVIEYVTEGSVAFHRKNFKRFGRVYGFYMGRRPVIAVSDPVILEKILVKDFQHFHNRPATLGQGRKPMDKSLLICDYVIWKKIRSVVSPTFSSGKIKQMLHFVNSSVDTYVQILSETSKNSEVVDVFGSFGRLTMEVIMSVAFGMDSDFQLKGNKALTKEACRWFQLNPIVFLIDIIPMPLALRSWIKEKAHPDPSFLVNLLRPVVEDRKKNKSERTDFLNLLLSENKKDGKSKLDDDEIFASAILFLLAGYETTSNALAYTLYLLALHQDVQQKLYDEIKENFNEDGPLYEETQKLTYLDSVLNESLRIYPPAYQTARVIQDNYKIGNMEFPAGVALQIPIYHIHHDEKLWEDPEKFDPSRFDLEKKSKISPYHFLPFGYGPRNCVGARFAIVEAKLAIIKILKKFKVQPAPETEIPLKLRFGLTMSPQNGIKLSVKERL